jgi:methanogenic corrinoid protein MtbC1
MAETWFIENDLRQGYAIARGRKMDINTELSQLVIENVARLSHQIVNDQHPNREKIASIFNLGQPELVDITQRDLYYLAEALFSHNPDIYAHQTYWLQSMLLSHGVPEAVVNNILQVTRQVLIGNFEKRFAPLIESYMPAVRPGINSFCAPQESLINASDPHYLLAWRFLKMLLAGDRQQAGQMIFTAVQSGASIQDIYIDVIQPCRYEVGRLWQNNDINVAREHYFSASTQVIMAQLSPLIFSPNKNGKTLIASCVPGELHDIGLRMVSDLLEMKGWTTYFLGANTPPASIIELIREKKADCVLLSASVPPFAAALRTMIATIRSHVPGKVKIIVGGLLFSLEPSYIRSIPADGFAVNALEALTVTERLAGIK